MSLAGVIKEIDYAHEKGFLFLFASYSPGLCVTRLVTHSLHIGAQFKHNYLVNEHELIVSNFKNVTKLYLIIMDNEPSTSSGKPKVSYEMDPNKSQEENLAILQEQSNRARRNALTPESHNIEPIRQTEIQEKMSSLTMASTSETNVNNSSNQQSG